MKKILLLFLLTGFTLYLNAQENIKEYIYFDTDQAEIKSEAVSLLNKLSAIVLKLNDPSIQLTGHTDDQGNHDYNLSLSKRRANAIRDYFLKKGMNPEQITFDFYGETNPVASNETEQDRQSNRRVEILISATPEAVPVVAAEIEEGLPIPVEPEETIKYTKTDLSELRKAPTVFCIRNDRDTVLQGEEGTTLFFKANSFDAKKITCNCINIELTEFYSAKDIILNNLDTESGNRLLETRGAINIEAFCNGENLSLKRGKKLDIHFPDVALNQGFQLFKGIEEAKEVNWVRNTRTYESTFFSGLPGWKSGNCIYEPFCDYNFFIKRWICHWKSRKNTKKSRSKYNSLLDELQKQNPEVNFENFRYGGGLAQVVVFTSNKLGYINCDRFLSLPKRQLADVYIKDGETSSMMTSVVFKDIQSVMNGQLNEDGEHWYRSIPKNKAVWIVAIKKEGQQFFLALEERNTNMEEITDLNFKEISQKDLLASLEAISW